LSILLGSAVAFTDFNNNFDWLCGGLHRLFHFVIHIDRICLIPVDFSWTGYFFVDNSQVDVFIYPGFDNLCDRISIHSRFHHLPTP